MGIVANERGTGEKVVARAGDGKGADGHKYGPVGKGEKKEVEEEGRMKG